MMFSGIKTWVLLAVVGAVVVTLAASHGLAYRAGGEAVRSAMLARSVTILRERIKTDDTMQLAGDDVLCRALGGMWNGTKCE